MSKYYIKTNFGYKVVEGKKTRSGFGFHKTDDGKFTITDIDSGLAVVSGIKSATGCKKYIEDKANLKDVEERKAKRVDYLKDVKSLKDYKKKNPLKDED